MTLAALAAGNAWALGLGEASGQIVIGQPLRIEIPVLGSNGNLPAASCFRVRPPVADVGSEFVLRNGRIQVVGERGATKLIVTTPTLIREPLIGFSIAAGCGFEISKDYVLLTAFPTDSQPEVSLPQPAPQPAAPAAAASAPATPTTANAAPPAGVRPVAPAAATPRKAAPPAAAVAATSADKTLHLNTDATLEGLAQQKYPLQPKAREKFVRMMAHANPDLKAGDAVIAAGTDLQVPAGLPQRRTGPYLGEGAAAKPAAAPAPAAAAAPAVPVAAAAPPPPAAKPAHAGKDRLVVGGGTEMTEAKLLAEAERLTAILVEQTKSQDAVTETLTRLEGTYSDLQKHYASLDNRLQRIEAERLAEKQAPKPASFDFFELLLAVIAGGAIGGLLLHVFQRQQARRNPAVENAPFAAPAAKTGFKLPWAKAAVTEPAAAVAAAADEMPAAMVAAVAAPIAVETPVAVPPAAIPEFLKPKSPPPQPVATESAPPDSADEDALSLDFPLMPEPVAAAPAAVETAQPSPVSAESAVAEIAIVAAAQPPQLEPLALDFPLIPEAKTEEPQELDLHVGETTVADSPAATVSKASPQDTLALDFPEIPMAAAEPEDAHVIEFEPVAKDPNALEFPKS